jgi:hypothetical protein
VQKWLYIVYYHHTTYYKPLKVNHTRKHC